MNEKRPLTLNLFLLRLSSGAAGGFGGMLIAFIAFFALSTFLPATDANSLNFFSIIVTAFLATISGNTIVAASLTFMDHDKYKRRKTSITQVFLFNVILFFLTIPLYLLAIPLELTVGVATVHFLLSAFVSALIMEVLAGYQYSLLGIYASALGIFISIGMALILLNSTVSEQLIILGAMPTVWIILVVVSGFAELIYDNFLKTYGVDALSTQTDLGGDALVEEEKKDEEENEDEDEMDEV